MIVITKKFQTAIAALAVMACQLQADDCLETADCPSVCTPCNTGRFFLDVDALYFRAYEGGLSSLCDISEASDSIENGIVISRLEGRGREPCFDWNWGYRIGAGYEFACGNAGIGAFWTHYDANSGKKNNKWKIDYNVVDILFRYGTSLSNSITIAPFGGIKLVEIDQKLHTNFFGIFNALPTLSSGQVKQKLDGIGPMIGLEGAFGTSFGLTLYGNASIALLFGNTRVRVNNTDLFNTGINFTQLKNHKDAYQFVFDAEFGVQWKKCFCGDKFFVLQLGVEDHRYFNHNQFCSYGDLSLDGINLGLSIEY